MALASAGQEAAWMRLLNSELCGSSMEEIIIYETIRAIRKFVSNGVVHLKYCPTKEMMADMLTKSLSHDQFVKL